MTHLEAPEISNNLREAKMQSNIANPSCLYGNRRTKRVKRRGMPYFQETYLGKCVADSGKRLFESTGSKQSPNVHL